MHHSCFVPATFLTNKVSFNKSIFACFIPNKSISFRSSAFPAGVIFPNLKFRLPLCHTAIVTKGFTRMKITSWAGNILTTPRTLLSYFVSWSAMFISPAMVTMRRTINSVKANITIKSLATSWAYPLNCMDFTLKSRHILIIPHIEIEEKYCEIAAKRCSQGIFKLNV